MPKSRQACRRGSVFIAKHSLGPITFFAGASFNFEEQYTRTSFIISSASVVRIQHNVGYENDMRLRELPFSFPKTLTSHHVSDLLDPMRGIARRSPGARLDRGCLPVPSCLLRPQNRYIRPLTDRRTRTYRLCPCDAPAAGSAFLRPFVANLPPHKLSPEIVI